MLPKKYRVEYRKGSKGVCSRNDWVKEYYNDSISCLRETLIQDGYDILSVTIIHKYKAIFSCKGNTTNYEHYFMVNEIKHR